KKVMGSLARRWRGDWRFEIQFKSLRSGAPSKNAQGIRISSSVNLMFTDRARRRSGGALEVAAKRCERLRRVSSVPCGYHPQGRSQETNMENRRVHLPKRDAIP